MSTSRSLPRTLVRGVSFVTYSAAALLTGAALAQHKDVPFQGGIPVAPTGLANKPLGDGPFEYATGEGQDIRVVVVTKELSFPFAIAFLPDGTMLVTERKADIRVIRNGKLDPKPVAGGPTGYFTGTSGLPGAVHGYMDLVLHPQFAQNQLMYLSYTKRVNDRNLTAVARMHWTGSAVDQVKDIWLSDETTAGAAPIVFGRDGKLYIATSGGDAQDPSSTAGKVLRINDDGSVPKDNPFVGQKAVPAGAKPGATAVEFLPAIYSLGHRSSLGLAVHPVTGEIWQSENGPNGGDELNIIKAGKNYGWPIVSYGRDYPGPGTTRSRRMKASRRRSFTGRPRSRSRASRSTPATSSRSGRATCSSADCAKARSRAPAISTASCSTTRWRSCAASRCSSIFTSEFAT